MIEDIILNKHRDCITFYEANGNAVPAYKLVRELAIKAQNPAIRMNSIIKAAELLTTGKGTEINLHEALMLIDGLITLPHVADYPDTLILALYRKGRIYSEPGELFDKNLACLCFEKVISISTMTPEIIKLQTASRTLLDLHGV